jgi:putative membrane protein
VEHGVHVAPVGSGVWASALVVLAVGALYAAGVLRLRTRGDRWPVARSAAAAGGIAAMGAALLPPLGDRPEFVAHVVGHLLLAMVAPLLLALAAPVTLALRALPTTGRRRLLAVLHSRPARALTWAPVVAVLELGGMYAFYLTDLFALAHAHPALMALVHLHMVLAGLLVGVVLVGRDPLPHRPGIVGCLLFLLAVAAGHDVLAKLMYARLLPTGAGGPDELRLGAQVMYYGGSAVEIALAVALMAGWYARGGRELRRARAREQNREQVGAPVPGGSRARG